MKHWLWLSLRIVLLAVVLFICIAIAAVLTGQHASPPQNSAEAGTGAKLVLLVCLLEAAVVTLIVRPSGWSGRELMVAVFLVLFGVKTVMPHTDSLIFLTNLLSPGTIARIVSMGTIASALFTPIAVIGLGRWRKQGVSRTAASPALSWASWRIAVVVLAYLLLYFSFGYFIAWKNPAVREYYGGTDPASFWLQLANVFRGKPWLPIFQALRAFLWIGLGALIIKMMRSPRWLSGLGVSLAFAVLMNGQLLIPNPYMPESVRMIHLVETASSNFLFGWILVWLLMPAGAGQTPTSNVGSAFTKQLS